MKKFLVNFLIISILLFYGSNTFAFVLKFDNFYTDISENTNTIESNVYSIDLEGKNGTKEKINQYSESNCINENLNENEIKEIVYNGNISFIKNKISQDCLLDNGNISTSVTSSLLGAINKVHNDTVQQAREKTSRLINLGNTGIYADGIEENSPFDIIKDFEKIDSIIFSEPSTQYEGNKFYDLMDELKDKGDEARQKINNTDNTQTNNQNDNLANNQNTSDNSNNIFPIINKDGEPIFSKNNCTITDGNSGLSVDTIINLKKELSDSDQTNKSPQNDDNEQVQGNTGVDNSGDTSDDNTTDSQEYSGSYSNVNDNSEFPCDGVFCIDIDFVTYEHNLLGGGFQDITIEYLINRSNEHLKKFASTSLVQSKMTMNNFELGLKDLNLPDIFHLGFQVTTKPVPILKLEDEEKKEDNSQFSSKNMMKFYYESYGLDYNKRNDLSLVKKIEQDLQSGLNSQLGGPKDYLSNIESYGDYTEKAAQERSTMQNSVENFTQGNIQNEFETQLKELTIFNRAINDYVNNLSAILKNMTKIPVDSGKS